MIAAFLLLFSALLSTYNARGMSEGTIAYRDSLCPNATNVTGSLTVDGFASMTERPDTATIIVRVFSTKKTAAEARNETADAAQSILDLWKAFPNWENSTTVQTQNVQLVANREDYLRMYSTVSNYTFSEDLNVIVRKDLENLVPAVIDSAIQAGGNHVQLNTLQFSLSPQLLYNAENALRSEAVKNAVETAKIMAKAAGAQLGAVTYIDDVTRFNNGMQNAMFKSPETLASNSASTPIVVGETELTGQVSINVDLCA